MPQCFRGRCGGGGNGGVVIITRGVLLWNISSYYRLLKYD